MDWAKTTARWDETIDVSWFGVPYSRGMSRSVHTKRQSVMISTMFGLHHDRICTCHDTKWSSSLQQLYFDSILFWNNEAYKLQYSHFANSVQDRSKVCLHVFLVRYYFRYHLIFLSSVIILRHLCALYDGVIIRWKWFQHCWSSVRRIQW